MSRKHSWFKPLNNLTAQFDQLIQGRLWRKVLMALAPDPHIRHEGLKP